MWVPLHLHSQYSILDGACPIASVAERAARYQMPACALTDHGNLHGAIEFYKAMLAVGVKPIIGCEFYVAPISRFEKKKVAQKSAYHLGLLAKDERGYRNLIALSSLGYLEGFYYHPRIDAELLEKHKEGLICLSGCLSSEVAQLALGYDEEAFFQKIGWYHNLFGDDYYLELQRHDMDPKELSSIEDPVFHLQYQEYIDKQKRVNGRLLEAHERFQIPYVATNDTHYIDKEHWYAHEVLINIQSGEPIEIWERDSQGEPKFRVPNPKRRMYSTHECYFKSPEEMALRFNDLPQALKNTLEVAEKCQLKLDFSKKFYPRYPLGGASEERDQQRQVAHLLRTLCEEGIPKRYTQARLDKIASKYPESNPSELVRKRLEYELDLILSKGMGDYLLIVWDIIHWAKNQKIPVGPGRGSGAGSIILYLIGVTDIEPLGFSLFFERFINPERISYPDIDIDICMDRRSEVIDYIVSKYGKESVAQIATFGSIKAKMAIRDVGRVLSIPLSKVNALAKLVPEDPTVTLQAAIETDPDLHRIAMSDSDAKKVLELGGALEGGVRSVGTHAAGLIICPGKLIDYIPVCLAKDSAIVATQYSMKPVETIGLLKIDVLGLKTLTCIQMAYAAVEKQTGRSIDSEDINFSDAATYQLISSGKTLGVFQMESGGMQELGRNVKPDCFEDIIAIGALYRPGPMEMIPSFINRKQGREPIEYDHPKLVPILQETYGVMVYQEQVMQIAQELAGYSLGEGDVLRRAMGKKDRVQMEKEREKFCKGAVGRGIETEIAERIFDKMEKFAAYGFNKSHAAAYAYLTYVTAYLKAHYPAIWMAALLTCDRDDTTKLAKWLREAISMGVRVLSPDVNESMSYFVATAGGIRFALTGIKGIGEGVVEAIIEERNARGPFLSFYDFFERIDLKRIGKKAIEHLVLAGAFDWTNWPREALKESIDEMYESLQQEQKQKEKGIITFFEIMDDQSHKDRFRAAPKVHAPLARTELFRFEKDLLGFYLTGHPLEGYLGDTKRLGVRPLGDVDEMADRSVLRIACVIEAVEVKYASKTQKKFAIIRVSDEFEQRELFVFSDLYEAKAALLEENRLLYLVLTVDKREETPRLIVSWLDDLAQLTDAMIRDCDRAYDRAKQPMRSYKGASKPYTKEEPASAMKIPALVVALELAQCRLSSIVALKRLLKKYGGQTPVTLEFFDEKRKCATLYLDKANGVMFNSELELELGTVSGIKSIAML